MAQLIQPFCAEYREIMKSFADLKKNLKLDTSKLSLVKVALLGDSSTQFLGVAIKGAGYDSGLDVQLWEADFNQIERQVFDPTSELYSCNPEFVIIFFSTHKLLNRYNKLVPADQTAFAQAHLELIENIANTIAENNRAKIICYNYPELDDGVFGNFANSIEASFLYQLRYINLELMRMAQKRKGFHICDLSTIQNRFGKQIMFHSPVYINTEMTISLDTLPWVAQRTIDIIAAQTGRFKKCLILDLDNTLWGGIIGDDGIENIQIGNLGIGKAFSELQYWIKKLKNRGIILCVCSKNTESIAKEPFENHPDMVLREDDISVFMANWDNKADNIRLIREILNIGFDSMVFIDDNPFERNMVRENIPEITVPELPEDPAEYLEYLYGLNLFETVGISENDSERTRQYQTEAKRISVSKSFVNEDDFLISLEMLSLVEGFNKFNTPRIAQLSQRSNQFNLRTVRYSEADVAEMAVMTGYHNFSFSLEDKFGDHGLICTVIMKSISDKELFIDTWFMSCRVLKRSMENFVMNTIAEYAGENGFKEIIGEYIPTPKNDIVKNHYRDLGFSESDNRWILDITQYAARKTFINRKKVRA